MDDEGTDEEEQNQAHELTSDRCVSQNDEEEMLVDQIFEENTIVRSTSCGRNFLLANFV